MLTIPHCKESLSRAYVTAVVGRSRNNLVWGREYDYGVDGTVRMLAPRGTRIRENGFGFDFQSKTTTDWEIDGTEVVYDLEANAYNDLAERAGTGAFPFLLVLLCLPKADDSWLDVTNEKLILQKCAFWAKLGGEQTANTGTRRIRIPVANVFTPTAVRAILGEIETGTMLP
ncbi:MAG TPA: DUF4365 domain-containing protein [Candidatus Limnocylindria bacterium]|jgi:hypothetical protein|nr:DUF4365 domain-containing protein [Candidatus Limnocylindria bacterium]